MTLSREWLNTKTIYLDWLSKTELKKYLRVIFFITACHYGGLLAFMKKMRLRISLGSIIFMKN